MSIARMEGATYEKVGRKEAVAICRSFVACGQIVSMNMNSVTIGETEARTAGNPPFPFPEPATFPSPFPAQSLVRCRGSRR